MSADSDRVEDIDERLFDEKIAGYVAEQNARIGETKPAPRERHTHRDYPLGLKYVTEDVICGYGNRMGDTNPLWRNPDYARQSPWGGLISAPLLIGGVPSLPDPPDIPGWAPMFGGNLTKIHKPVRHGDVLDADDVWLGYEDMSRPDRPHKTFLMKAERRFRNQHGEPVTTLLCRALCVAPRPGQKMASLTRGRPRSRPRYTEQQLDEIYSHYDDELAGKLRRGNSPRYWEDVREGDDVGLVIKGPLDVTDQAASGTGVAFAAKWELIRGEKLHSPRDPETNAYHFQMAWHFVDSVAQSQGMPYALSFGVFVEHWFAHAATNWTGDHGFVREVEVRIPAPMFVGDTMWITGKVARTYEENGRGLVELRLRGAELDDIELANARILVQLPHRGRPNEVVEDVMSTKRNST